MSVVTSLLLVVVGFVAAEDARPLRIEARAAWPYAKADPQARQNGQQLVVRSPLELTTIAPWNQLDVPPPAAAKIAETEVAKLLNVAKIDWKRQMAIVVTAGTRPSGGWRVRVDAVRVEGKKLVISWSALPPRGAAITVLTHPGTVVLVERFEGPATFTQTGAPKLEL